MGSSRGGAPTHSGRRTDEERRAIESGGYSRGGMRRPGSSGELTTGLSDDDDGDAAGAAAERKIAATRQNLLRVNDVLGELDGRLTVLRRQAQKAERYKRLVLHGQ